MPRPGGISCGHNWIQTCIPGFSPGWPSKSHFVTCVVAWGTPPANCPRRVRRREPQKSLQGAPASRWRHQWSQDVCAEFNTRGTCLLQERCKYHNSCGNCGGDHPTKGKGCPSKSKAMGSQPSRAGSV